MDVVVPSYLAREFGSRDPAWLDALPGLAEELVTRWDLRVGEPLGDPPAPAGWVAPGVAADGTPVFLKVGWPHAEAETEAAGLRFFDGTGSVRLLASDEACFALVTERALPGQPLTDLAVDEGNAIAVTVLQRLWRPTEHDNHGLGSLADTVAEWNASYDETRRNYPAALVEAAIELGTHLSQTQPTQVVLHGDFNPTNVLRSQELGWITIDPKPLVGDPAYDLAQFLANRVDQADTTGAPDRELARQVRFFADALHLDPERVAGWAVVKSIGWNWGPDAAALFTKVHDQIT